MEVYYLLTGVVAGVLAGMFGVGGGLIIVPALFFAFSQQGIIPPDLIMQTALGTSLATIMVTSLSSAYSHYRRQAIMFPVFFALTPGLILGAIFSGYLAVLLRSATLTIIFAVFELLVAIQMFFSFKLNAARQLPDVVVNVAVGGGIGLVSGIVGIGGGSLTVPYLSWCNIDMRKAVATSAACGFPIALAGTLGFIWAGRHVSGLPAYSSGFVYWVPFAYIAITSILFAPVGAWVAHRLHSLWLKRLFALLLTIIGVKLLWTVIV